MRMTMILFWTIASISMALAFVRDRNCPLMVIHTGGLTQGVCAR